MIFARPPAAGDLPRWAAAFAEEIGPPERVGHVAFGIDGTDGDAGEIAPFVDDGFALDRGIVLTARAVREPPRPNHQVEVRPLASDPDWAAAVETQALYGPESMRTEPFREFKRRQLLRYRAMSEAGRGHWFGAFLGDALVADLGVFVGDGVARYQSVGTHPHHRGKGVAGTLVHHAGRHALRHYGVRTLVIVADEGAPAERVYRSVGFEPAERTVGLVKRIGAQG